MDRPAPLPRLKGRFPFRLAATSFLYPASWAANCRRLAPYVDEIELLFFSSRSKDDTPPRAEITELAGIAASTPLRYNVHLPIDIRPGSSDRDIRIAAVETIQRYVDLTRSLDPTTWTLHLPMEPSLSRQGWQANIRDSLSRILAAGYPSRGFSIKTLDYPLHWAADIISDYDLSVCIDIGHLLRYDQPLRETVAAWRNRIAIFHLHGVSGGRDHLSLDHLSAETLLSVHQCLARFCETVSLELFNLADFAASAQMLRDLFFKDSP